MGYTFGTFQMRNINKAGADLLSTTTVLVPPAVPTVVVETAIGNRIIISFSITGTGAETFTNQQVRVNFSPFRATGIAPSGLGFESDGYVDATLKEGIFIGNPSPFAFPLTAKNLKVRFQKTAPRVCYVEIEFYMTMDVAAYINNSNYSNLDRFLKASVSGSTLVNDGPAVYNAQKEFGIQADVFNLSVPTSLNVLTATGSTVQRIPWQSRFYNSYLGGVTANARYMSNLQITTPSATAAGIPFVAQATATGPQPIGQTVDSSFTVLTNQLSTIEKNTVAIELEGRANPSITPNAATTNIRVLLIRTSPLTNTVDFETDLLLNDAVIPALNATNTQIDGAIWNPSAWVDVAAETTDLTFTIDGASLQVGSSYRIIVNVYDNVNDRLTTHISPELIANFVPPVVPTITGELGTYNKVYLGNDLSSVAPHSRFKSRLTIDKVAFNAQLVALGIGGNFDNAFQQARAALPLISGVTPQIRFYQKNTLALPANNAIVSDGMVIVADTATELVLDAYFRVVEEQAGITFTIDWAIAFRTRTFVVGQNLEYEVLFTQNVTPRLFENDEASPKLLSAKFYDYDEYPANKVEVFDLCGRDYIICEIEKDPTLTGSVNFAACIYPATSTGDTSLLSIEEEESWLPLVQILPQLSSPKLDNVDTSFGSDDFAAFRINLQQLPQNQLFWITGIAYEQVPNYCPLGLVQNILITNIRPAAAPYWAISASAANFVNEILAHPDYVSGATVVYHRVVDSLGVSVPFFGLSTTVIANDTLVTVAMPPQPEVYYELRIDANFDSGFGLHLISHTLRVTITLMPENDPAVSYDTNTYICNDLG
jgi:hypothetical protein